MPRKDGSIANNFFLKNMDIEEEISLMKPMYEMKLENNRPVLVRTDVPITRKQRRDVHLQKAFRSLNCAIPQYKQGNARINSAESKSTT